MIADHIHLIGDHIGLIAGGIVPIISGIAPGNSISVLIGRGNGASPGHIDASVDQTDASLDLDVASRR